MVMLSKYAGKCGACGGRINPGTMIEWEKGKGAKHAVVADCARSVPVPPAVPFDGAQAIVAFLRAAQGRGLKWPKVRFLAPGGGELRMSLSGPRSKERDA
jgi:hypothetical protein